jgi:hypothetical protein
LELNGKLIRPEAEWIQFLWNRVYSAQGAEWIGNQINSGEAIATPNEDGEEWIFLPSFRGLIRPGPSGFGSFGTEFIQPRGLSGSGIRSTRA